MGKISETPFLILDTETTGPDPKSDLPIEVAVVTWDGYRMGEPQSWLVHPGRSIPPGSSAIHHLTDKDIEGAPALERILPEILTLAEGRVILAHNAPFDLAMIPALSQHPALCLLKLSKQIWPKYTANPKRHPLASHKQQEIRYWLELEVDTRGLPAHRAASDILVTGAIFSKAVEAFLSYGGEDDFGALLELSERHARVDRMPPNFGKHGGKFLADIEPDYLEWLVKKNADRPMDPDLFASVKDELQRRKALAIVATRNIQPAVFPEQSANR